MSKLRKYYDEAEKVKSVLKPGVQYRKSDVAELAKEVGVDSTAVNYIVPRMLVQNRPGSPLYELEVEKTPEPAMNLATGVTSIKSAEVFIPKVMIDQYKLQMNSVCFVEVMPTPKEELKMVALGCFIRFIFPALRVTVKQ